MISENIYLAILVASIATYISRAGGVLFSSRINTKSEIFKLISYISLGVVVAIIARIIIFPKGMLSEIPSVLKYTSVLTLIVSYYLFKKNVILSTLLACIFFYICLKLFDY